MVKYLTQYSNRKDFFSGLKENEVFMYSYLDFKWEDIIKIAEENNVDVEYIKKGTDEYKQYGECAAKVLKIGGRIYEYKVGSEEVIKVEARDEAAARIKLVEKLFKNNYITLKKAN
ncbi:hypothetical protein JK636_17000 [Clostridium sp. YIM B02515]|uniref:Uncharacterized protein n=1 Tax=Clostridium rhizosphaerae TaxID=2803861 RepID=A0ABS1TDW4_9CLOT|nr:hypothetical protein [Clostridium rhizosphaerae]MBL4937421.1 hypothetical protein [Clostridium rhizosphaerae]